MWERSNPQGKLPRWDGHLLAFPSTKCCRLFETGVANAAKLSV